VYQPVLTSFPVLTAARPEFPEFTFNLLRQLAFTLVIGPFFSGAESI